MTNIAYTDRQTYRQTDHATLTSVAIAAALLMFYTLALHDIEQKKKKKEESVFHH